MTFEHLSAFLPTLTNPVNPTRLGSMTVGLENLMGLQTAAERLKLSRSRLYQFCTEGRLGERVDGRWLISEAEIRLFQQIERPNGRPPKKNQE